MDFAQAIKAMREGKKVQREGWNGKGMFLFQISENTWNFETDIGGVDDLETDSFICMKTAVDTLIPWLASQADMQAKDWCFVPDA